MGWPAFRERSKPGRCPDCSKKGVSPNSYECRYCGWSCYPPTAAAYREAGRRSATAAPPSTGEER